MIPLAEKRREICLGPLAHHNSKKSCQSYHVTCANPCFHRFHSRFLQQKVRCLQQKKHYHLDKPLWQTDFLQVSACEALGEASEYLSSRTKTGFEVCRVPLMTRLSLDVLHSNQEAWKNPQMAVQICSVLQVDSVSVSISVFVKFSS